MTSLARHACGAITIALVLAIAPIARADTTNLDLTWEAPPGCATRAEIVERVGRLLGDGTRARQNVRAHAIVSETSDHKAYRADLELASGGEASSHRTVDGESCPAVADAVVTIVALAIDPEAAVSAPRPASARQPPSPPPAPGRPLRFSIGVAARVDVGSVPAAAFGGQAILGASYRGASAEIDGSLLASARATLGGSDNDEGADIAMREIGGRLSYALELGPLELGPRVGLHARWLSATGFGAAVTHDGLALFGVFSFGVLAKLHLTKHLALRAAADVGIPLSRPTFDIDAGRVYGVAPESLALTLGAELIF